ncbi:unnamed protein product [Owenia fusiformis]|uniref:Uncharacterized protein n=1 Tax=Owenia fusiformis TaxID=6347 RepID=A0A8J1ULQ7_OWEFU|nr:unnamed protein product [Owenia fusiformis]
MGVGASVPQQPSSTPDPDTYYKQQYWQQQQHHQHHEPVKFNHDVYNQRPWHFHQQAHEGNRYDPYNGYESQLSLQQQQWKATQEQQQKLQAQWDEYNIKQKEYQQKLIEYEKEKHVYEQELREQERKEQERIEQEKKEQARIEQDKKEQEQIEQERKERAREADENKGQSNDQRDIIKQWEVFFLALEDDQKAQWEKYFKQLEQIQEDGSRELDAQQRGQLAAYQRLNNPKPLLRQPTQKQYQYTVDTKYHLFESTYNFSVTPRWKISSTRPRVSQGNVWTDPNFTFDTAIPGERYAETKTKLGYFRPQEVKKYGEVPLCLFHNSTSKFDIGQGGVGTCWFLATIAALAEKPEAMRNIFPSDCYKLNTIEYDGVFHCRLFWAGEWVDIYVDDLLPAYKRNKEVWGARGVEQGKDDFTGELWVSLLEKGLSKFMGSYEQAASNTGRFAFVLLTGGCTNLVEIHNNDKFADRLRRALASSAFVTTSFHETPEEKASGKSNRLGLVSSHLYSLTGCVQVDAHGRPTTLVRLRNPWGHKEWNGPWSDKSPEWNKITVERKSQLMNKSDDGEFWMSLEDFSQYFQNCNFCSFTPDVDFDGEPDPLNYVTNILGEFRDCGEGIGGPARSDYMRNSTYVVEVPGDPSENIPLVVQFTSKRFPKDEENISMGIVVFKVYREQEGEKCLNVVQLKPTEKSMNTYYNSYVYFSTPGKFLVLPYVFSDVSKDIGAHYNIRVFTKVPVTNCREYKPGSGTIFLAPSMTEEFKAKGITYKPEKVQFHDGAWVKGENNGGWTSSKTFHTNPQYEFTIPPGEHEPLMVSLSIPLPTKNEPTLGIILFGPFNNNFKIPFQHKNPSRLQTALLVQEDDNASAKTYIYMKYFGVNANYLLGPGRYVLIPNLKSLIEFKYSLTMVFKNEISVKCHRRGFNTSKKTSKR